MNFGAVADTGDAINIALGATAVGSQAFVATNTSSVRTQSMIQVDDNNTTGTVATFDLNVASTRGGLFDIDTSGAFGTENLIDITTGAQAWTSNIIDVNVGAGAATGDVINIALGATAVGSQAFVATNTSSVRTQSMIQVDDNNTTGTVATFDLNGASTRGGLFDIDWSGALTTENLIDIDANSIATASLLDLTANGLTTGSAIAAASSGTIATGGELLSLSATGITTGRIIDVSSAANTLTSGQLVNIATSATSITGSSTTGSLINLSATGVMTGSFSGNLGYLEWAPGSAATAAGNLLTINIGANGTTSGDLFQVQDASSDLFAVNEGQITSAIPHQFTAAGDIAAAYDLQFTNQTASFIKSNAPLTIEAGESFENNNLTLQTYGTGAVIVDRKFALDTQNTLAVNDTTPSVAAGNSFITANSSATVISTFDEGTAGQILFVEINDANTDFDCTASGINCGSADITIPAAGDLFSFIFDGTTWNMIGWMDASNSYNSAGGADVAEMYVGTNEMQPGDVVSIDESQNIRIEKSTASDGQRVIGVISTNPGLTLNDEDGPADLAIKPVALVGRVPVRISAGSDAIQPGDLLGASSELGKAQKVTGGFIIGRALESWVPGSGQETIKVFVNPIYIAESGIAGYESLDARLAIVEGRFSVNDEGQDVFAIDVVQTDELTVLGQSVLSDTVINGDLNIGTLQISSSDNSIDSVGTLKIQSLALGDIEIMNGLVTIDTEGNVVVNTITAQKYQVAGASAGSSTLPAGSTQIIITNPVVTANSMIFVTPKTVTSRQLVVTEKIDGVSFKVEVSSSSSTDIEFDWWIVERTP